MNVPAEIRYRLFWIKDLFRNREIKKHLRIIKSIIEHPVSEQTRKVKETALTKLLNHAVTTTYFYTNLKLWKSISDFPVINKNIVRSNFQDFTSAAFNENNTTKVMTSGSTGTPLTILQDVGKRARNTADTIYFAGRGNFKIGKKLIFIKLWAEEVKKSNFTAWLQNIRMVNVTDLSDAYFASLIEELKNDKSQKGILGYVSALTQLCKYLDKTNSPPIACNITSIIAISECLTDYCKTSMEKYFGVPVMSRYSNIENGIIAQQVPERGNEYLINWASYYVEILDLEQDIPLNAGELGRIVITDLFNYSMPLIRYDTGDLGSMSMSSAGDLVLDTIQGRKLDTIFDTNGRVISSAVVWELEYYNQIKQFQLIQTSQKSYTFKLSLDEKFREGEKLIDRFKTYFGDDALITIEETNEIPVLSSGKRRLVVNQFNR